MINKTICISFFDKSIVINGEAYIVDLDASKFNSYDIIFWSTEEKFCQKYPGIRVLDLQNTKEDYEKYVAEFIPLWESAKERAEEEGQLNAPDEEDLTKMALTSTDSASIRAMRGILLTLIEGSPEIGNAASSDVEKLRALESAAVELRKTL